MKLMISLLGSLAQDYFNSGVPMEGFLEIAKQKFELRHFWVQGRLNICKSDEAEWELRAQGLTNRGELGQ